MRRLGEIDVISPSRRMLPMLSLQSHSMCAVGEIPLGHGEINMLSPHAVTGQSMGSMGRAGM
jgi:hypothetical protein